MPFKCPHEDLSGFTGSLRICVYLCALLSHASVCVCVCVCVCVSVGVAVGLQAGSEEQRDAGC